MPSRPLTLDELASRRWFLPSLVLAAALALGILGISASVLFQERGQGPPPRTSTAVPRLAPAPRALPDNARVDPRLLDPANGSKLAAIYVLLFRAYSEGGFPAAEAMARNLGLLDDNNIEAVLILDRPYTEAFGQRLRAMGVEVESWHDNRVTVQLPIDRLLQLSAQREFDYLRALLSFPEIIDVDAPQRPERDEVVPLASAEREGALPASSGSVEGVKVTGADKWHAAGIRGQNVRVGIIDSFAKYRELQGRYLPPASQIIARDFTGKGFERETDIHGTGVAQIIYEMAPDATLLFANTDDLTQFLNAMDWLLSQRVDIISISLGFPNFAFDGTSPAARKIDEARQRGVLVVVSAGNEGNKSVLGQSTGVPGLVPIMPDGPEFIPVSYWARSDVLPLVRLIWANPQAEFVLHLADSAGKIYASFERRAVSGQPVIVGALDRKIGTDSFLVAVEQKSGPPTLFRVQVARGEIPPVYRSASRSIVDTASARGAVAVAAADWKTGQLAVYSSWGPTLDGRWKPEITAPSHVSVFVYQDQEYGFAGTSAAAPHVSGAAALVKSRFPNWTADQIQKFLLEHAVSLRPGGAYGYYATGVGLLKLPDPSSLR
ncbi:MAG: S8 family serine peptidase [Chloroflexota bacterium]|nr:S8 family serine peptidase [Dehalococcoidia bacterium]MDW8252921.1 S8 family serine peptidase [Chloroflexota bacterium]